MVSGIYDWRVRAKEEKGQEGSICKQIDHVKGIRIKVKMFSFIFTKIAITQ